MNDNSSQTYCLALLEAARVARGKDHESKVVQTERAEPTWSYHARLGRDPILLDYVEYRILKLLASRPYHAFTCQHIAEAVTSERHPVTPETLGGHIASLRDKLGFFADYVQSVPYIGYRFKE